MFVPSDVAVLIAAIGIAILEPSTKRRSLEDAFSEPSSGRPRFLNKANSTMKVPIAHMRNQPFGWTEI